MQRLNRGMMRRYEIPDRLPAAINAVQFGLGERLLGVVDRLIDDAGAGVGIACVPPAGAYAGDGADPAALLREQEGMFTLLIRGYRGETPVKREQVVQSVIRVPEGGEYLSLAELPGLGLMLLDAEADGRDGAIDQAARLLSARQAAGLGGPDVVVLGEDADCAERVRDALAEREPGLGRWLAENCEFCPALAEGLVCRADAREAAAQCAEMNYADGMLHLAEPFARLTVQASPAFRQRWPLDAAEGIAFTDDIAPALARKHRLYDAGLFAMAAPGWLLGCDTLSDCMKLERLRAFVGRAYFDELLPADPAKRADDANYVIECFERFENPLTRNAILRAGAGLLRRFTRGALPVIRAWAAENFEPPRRLSFALAATIMLLAGARPDGDGRWQVLRGSRAEPILEDPAALEVFRTLSHDMPPEALAYAALADRELWQGEDLRDIDGLEQRVALDIANIQRQPDWLPEEA